jgi:membrane-associated protease RseP (regulator of RpoE activity)
LRLVHAIALATLLIARAASGEGYLGAELRELDGRVVVRDVEHLSPAALAGISRGDVVLSVGGKSIKSAKQVEEIVAAAEPDKLLRFEILGLTGRQAAKVRVGDAAEWRKRKEEERVRMAAADAAAAKAAENLRKRILDGGPLLVVGKVRDNAIGRPEIILLTENLGGSPIEAVEFEVAMYDKFGRPATGLWGDTHRKTFVAQDVIAAGQEKVIVLGIPWHETAGRVDVAATRYVMPGDRILTPPNPPVVQVRR